MKALFRDALGGILLVAFFISTLALSTYHERIFVSPDENAAFFFAQTFALTGDLEATEPLNKALQGALHPRSMVAIGSSLLPGSFIGLPIMTGALNYLFGDAASLLFTPLLALFAVLAWRRIIRVTFEDETLADLSAFFLMMHPSFWYYSGRVMMHNVSFIAFLIFGAYFLIVSPLKDVRTRFTRELQQFECFLAGIMFGTALFLRTVEATWVLVGVGALLVIYRNQLGWRRIIAVVMGLMVMGGVIAYANNEVYGGPALTGYTVRAELGGEASTITPIVPTYSEQIFAYLFPFGIHPRAIMRHEWRYEFLLYPWMAIPTLIGFGLLLIRKFDQNRSWKVFIIGTTILAFWLGAIYGSWSFNDNPDPRLITIGNSYVRYWMPLFVLSSPFAAYAILSLYRWMKVKLEGRPSPVRMVPVALSAVILLIVSIFSTNLVFFGNDGIVPTRSALNSFIEKRRHILPLTEADSVIIVDRADKYLFPSRRVITPLRSEQTYAALPEIVNYVPLYYFGITFPEHDFTYLNTEKLASLGLQIELIATFDDESLYKVTKVK